MFAQTILILCKSLINVNLGEFQFAVNSLINACSGEFISLNLKS